MIAMFHPSPVTIFCFYFFLLWSATNSPVLLFFLFFIFSFSTSLKQHKDPLFGDLVRTAGGTQFHKLIRANIRTRDTRL